MGWIHTVMDLFLHLDKHLDSAAHHMGHKLYLLLFAIVFCETGLVVTPFLPGDSLLFALGALAAAGTGVNLPLAIVLLCVAANCGDIVNYFLGYHVGPKLFSKPNSLLFNRRHLDEAQRFYDRHGRATIIMARFVPIIRTFAPFVAGIGRMPFLRFIAFSVSGGVLWVVSLSLAGYFFGSMPIVKKNFEIVILAIIVISVLPAILHAWKARKQSAQRGFAPLPHDTSGK
ncbi:MAG: putative rane-associated protein [Phycisphaerales bacterium]|jgi:membrane-associated protein|nr:putative rane-associated protein [Phycisphaerales bacterium]